MAKRKLTKNTSAKKNNNYPAVNLKFNGHKATARKTKGGYKWDGFHYEASVNKRGNNYNINVRKKGLLEKIFG